MPDVLCEQGIVVEFFPRCRGIPLMSSVKLPRPIVFCGPSGSGKSTLVARLMKDFPNKFGFSVSHTTRKPRPNEIDGIHYHFTNIEDMEKAIEEGKFLETATFGGNMYGTSKAAVEALAKSSKVCILDIDVQGVKQIKQSSLNPWYVFIEPPSIEELEIRLIARNTETKESLTHRLKVAEAELKYGRTPGNFDLVITNDDLDEAYNRLQMFVKDNVLLDDINN